MQSIRPVLRNNVVQKENLIWSCGVQHGNPNPESSFLAFPQHLVMKSPSGHISHCNMRSAKAEQLGFQAAFEALHTRQLKYVQITCMGAILKSGGLPPSHLLLCPSPLKFGKPVCDWLPLYTMQSVALVTDAIIFSWQPKQ
ncbi:hypothetical protein NDU88_006335 [Pleurodeles waltl]|uniref:Uncharacterized protein n=1 Tax=Pleurodeles waltl TaxID=8319 RepID=A0AAV7WC85_PLEWA|nr:hypothetical protein NDU88_006335 [Pleurodeles waltl]